MSPLDYAPPDGPPDPPGGGNRDSDEPDPNPDPESSNHGKPAQSGKKPDAKDKPKGPDLSDKLGKDGKLKGDERERHIKEGLCLYCGKPGHVATAKARASKVEPTESVVSKK
jgi:hypothetical protein